MIKMEIKGLLMDPVSNMPVVILRDTEKGHFLPIWVGIFEANAIALEMEKVQTPRPMTHDLLKNVLAQLDTRVEIAGHQVCGADVVTPLVAPVERVDARVLQKPSHDRHHVDRV